MKLRKIKIGFWTEPSQTKPNKSIMVNTCTLIRTLFSGLPPAKIPRGLEAFELMKDLHQALVKAHDKEYLYLPENVYTFLQKECFPNIPATWGMMKDVSIAVTDLIDAELVEVNIEPSEPQQEQKPQPVPEAEP